MSLGLFTLQDEAPYTIFAQVAAAIPSDSDSAPANGADNISLEYDEAVITMTPLNNLNGNTVEFRNIAERTSTIAIQQLLPNPATTNLNLRVFNKKEADVQVNILSPQGQVLLEQKELVKEGVNFIEVPIDFLPSGIYFMLLEGTGTRPRPIRFVKQRL